MSHPPYTAGSDAPMHEPVSGFIECAECRNEIPDDDEFNCEHCGASLCANCLLHHADECASAG
jgi:hypothetical protein